MSTINKQIQNGLSALGEDISVDGAIGTQTLKSAQTFTKVSAELLKTDKKAYYEAIKESVVARAIDLLSREDLSKQEIKDLQHAFRFLGYKGTSIVDGKAGILTGCGIFHFLEFQGIDESLLNNKKLKNAYTLYYERYGDKAKSQIARTLYPKDTKLDEMPQTRLLSYEAKDGSIIDVPLERPLDEGDLSSYYGMRLHPIYKLFKHHDGVDYSARLGAPVKASTDGEVVKVEKKKKGYGYNVIVRHHGGEVETRYGHLNAFALGLRKGSIVSKGDVIGYVGQTGDATSPHLHYEIKVKGKLVDPHTLPEFYEYTLDEIVVKADKVEIETETPPPVIEETPAESTFVYPPIMKVDVSVPPSYDGLFQLVNIEQK